jgi:hypothetical protein
MKQNRTHILHGGNPIILHAEYYAFVTTSATLEVTLPFTNLESHAFGIVGTPAADEVLSIDETVVGTPGSDAVIRGSNGSMVVTVTRTGASKTSGLVFGLIAFGR